MTDRLRLRISPCPNDTFMFEALLNGRIPTQGLAFADGRDVPAKMVDNFHQFCTSFATATPQAVPGVQWFPASVADAWAKSAHARLRENPNVFSV